jgi:hypothetical protein
MDKQRGGAPLHYSPDGKWWWDGERWVPAKQTPQPVTSNSRQSRRERWASVTALVVGALVLAAAASGALSVLPSRAAVGHYREGLRDQRTGNWRAAEVEYEAALASSHSSPVIRPGYAVMVCRRVR